jgi:hypothetical protein
VNRDAIEDWLIRKGQTRTEESTGSQGNIPRPTSSLDSDSQPIRSAKRQRTDRPRGSLSSSQPLSKKPRRAGTVETARFQSASQETVSSQGQLREIKDSYEEQSVSKTSGRIRVEIPVDEGFDRDAYSKVTVISSQPSQPTQNSKPSQLSRPATFSQSQSKSTQRRPFIWDEEDEEADRVPIVPDSQFLPGYSPYTPSQTQASLAAVTTRSNTGTDSDLAKSNSLARTSAVAENSTGSSYRQSEPPSHPSKTSSLGDSELASSGVDGSGQIPPPDRQQPNTFADWSQDTYSLPASSDFEPLQSPPYPSNPRSGPATLDSVETTDLQTSSETQLPAPVRGSRSQEVSHTLSPVQSHQASCSVSEESSLQFHTQVPRATASPDEISSGNTSHHVRQM